MKRRWIALGSPRTLALLASLCLNVLMASYIAKQWFGPSPPALGAAAPPRVIRFVADRLPSADAATLWRVYGAKEQALRDTQADYERSLRRAGDLLAQPEVDAAALRGAVMEAREKRIKQGDIVIETFLEAFPQLSPQGRQDLIGRLRRR
ncbi:MAG TPA: periplasmic heavy metal sensor [Xanthobacteraceae bacterium]|nr:periplasmic heavy metal sensor [Xanthobacteraceae bacterium]